MTLKQKILIFLLIFHASLSAIPESVLVFAPHPDDDVIGCGGAIIQHVKKEDHVTIVYMTSGEAAPRRGFPEKLEKIREQEAAQAAAIMGVHDLIFLREPDSKLQVTEITVGRVVDILLKYQPHSIYVAHEGESHKDHQFTFKIVMAAIKQSIEKGVQKPEILCYEVWPPMQNMTFVKDISKEMDCKLQALREHKTQLNHTNYVDAVEGLNRYRGIMSHKGHYAECFLKLDILHNSPNL